MMESNNNQFISKNTKRRKKMTGRKLHHFSITRILHLTSLINQHSLYLLLRRKLQFFILIAIKTTGQQQKRMEKEKVSIYFVRNFTLGFNEFILKFLFCFIEVNTEHYYNPPLMRCIAMKEQTLIQCFHFVISFSYSSFSNFQT